MKAEDYAILPEDPLRPPETIMRLARMGSFFPTRLSFMRSLIRLLASEQARITRPVWEINAQGYGSAVYSVMLGGHVYSLCCFSTPLDPEQRTDRVIAEAWDSSFTLYDGTPDKAELDRLEANAPRQEAGRFEATDLILSRANKSLRLFEHVAQSLSEGRQPDEAMIGDIGYLMRTTAVYGNGKFGIADRAHIAARPFMGHPFRLEMLSVYLIRCFTHDLVEHVARARGGEKAARLDARLKRHIGIGNSTGLGMAPFLVTHPNLLNAWMMARETALARIKAVERASAHEIAGFIALLARAQTHLAEWVVADERQMRRIEILRSEMQALAGDIDAEWLARPHPWRALSERSDSLSMEAQELVISLMLEPYGALVDGLTDCMACDESLALDPAMRLHDLAALLEAHCGWALDRDLDAPEAQSRFWYVSIEKLEPRLGARFEEDGAERETPLDLCRDLQTLHAALKDAPDDDITAAFLLKRPDLRHVVRRVQNIAKRPYAQIRDNLVADDCLPIDMLRCKLSFFGASKFDPKSDRWTRITLYQGAPLPDELTHAGADDWCFPALGRA